MYTLYCVYTETTTDPSRLLRGSYSWIKTHILTKFSKTNASKRYSCETLQTESFDLSVSYETEMCVHLQHIRVHRENSMSVVVAEI